MRIIVVGYGIQGRKRAAIAGPELVAVVDPVADGAKYRRLEEVPVDSYDAALVCTPDEPKIALLEYLIGQGKHALVEKPLFAAKSADIARLRDLARDRRVSCYTAYNHRFEPHIVRLKQLVESGELGQIYAARFFYGNGTARDVRNSAWRDTGAGVLPDLGSHLLDMALFLFGRPAGEFKVWTANRFENRAFDHIAFGGSGKPLLEMEMTLLSWRNDFVCDVVAENGSTHIRSLCKWGPTTFTRRRRVLPSGRPTEETVELVQPDPTWAVEYEHFKRLCGTGGSNLDNDLWINDTLAALSRQALERAP